MQETIHPKYEAITVACSCGKRFSSASTLCKDLNLEICGHCHPFYSGQQKIVDTAGFVDKFKKKYANRGKR